MFKLKNYQERTLEVLRAYLETARFKGAEIAFNEVGIKHELKLKAYKSLEGLPLVPFICLRLPTGGGKTFLSANCIPLAAETYLEQDYPLVLWLVPTNTIRQQTLETLKKPNHPNHEALSKAFNGQIMVIDIEDFAQIRPQDLKSKAVIVLGTIQTLRIDKTEGRKVYAHNENLESHFSKVAQNTDNMDRIEEGDNKGKLKFSFRNLLNLHRPLVIIDEAHNASSPLSFEVLQRINPSCVIEYTATPETRTSNVLFNVSASELKAEEMIKLPIVLSVQKTWQEAVSDAVRAREKLNEVAKKDRDYIRPIVLFQAEKKDREITQQVVLDYLITQEQIDRTRIAIVTGEQRELDGINLFDPSCKIDFVITVEALKEGWDCSFAYIFCSVANVQSKTSVEQILGRVLRMPYAKRREEADLNKAYAFVSKSSWGDTVQFLHDRLVDMGFDKQEADSFIEQKDFEFGHPQPTSTGFREPEPLKFQVEKKPDLSKFTAEEAAAVSIEKTDIGYEIKISGALSQQTEEKLVKAMPREQQAAIKTKIGIHNANVRKLLSPSQKGEIFKVPQLCVWINGELELAEKEILLDSKGWNLLDYPSEFTENEFKLSENGKTYEIDLRGDKLTERLVGTTEQLNLDLVDTGITDLQLSRWLDVKLRQPDIKQEVLLEYCRRVIASFEKRGLAVPTLARAKFLLDKFLQEKIKLYRKDAYDKGYQQLLFAPDAKVEASYNFDFSFGKDDYAPRWFYEGSWQFNKHFYSSIGELDNKGEEFECAKVIDENPNVKYWIRNLERQPKAFWLQTSSDKFYPDFVALLNDGRVLVIEYKGQDRISNDDSKEKRNIGQLWQEKSNKTAIFAMLTYQSSITLASQIAKVL